MGRKGCTKHEHTKPEHRLRDGRCRQCHSEAAERYQARTREAYRLLREQVENTPRGFTD
jgi:hypothetical protein